jgi:F0F1-type ATP synthase membrane subunit b/b'
MLFILFRKANLGLAFSTRRESIKNELEKARQERDAALEKLKEVEERLTGLSNQIASINENTKREAEGRTRADRESNGRGNCQADHPGPTRDRKRRPTAKKDLQRFTAEQSVRLAEEMLKREMRPEDDARLIARNIEEMGASG